MKKIINVFVLIFIIFSSTIFASEKKIVIGVPEEWSNKLGIVKDLLRESYKEIGYEVIFSELPLARGMVELSHGRIDGELARSEFVARKYNLTIVNPPYFTLKGYAYYLKEKFKKIPTIDEIKKGRIGYIRGSFNTENFFIDAKSPIIVNNEEQLISLLIKNRVDFVSPITTSFAKGNNKFGRILLFEISIHHILSTNNKELAKMLAPVLKKNMSKKKNRDLQKQVQLLLQPH